MYLGGVASKRLEPRGGRKVLWVVDAGMDASLETGLLLERKAFEILFSSEDQKEGMAAFVERYCFIVAVY